MSSVEAVIQPSEQRLFNTHQRRRGQRDNNETLVGDGTSHTGPREAEPSSAITLTSHTAISSGHSVSENERELRKGRARGRGRGRGRGSQVRGLGNTGGVRGDPRQENSRQLVEPNGARLPSRRQFGHQLTVQNAQDQSDFAPSSLDPDAPIFIPGRQVDPKVGRGKAEHSRQKRGQPAKLQRARERRESIKKSSAPDIPTRTHDDIANSAYECPICTSEVDSRSRIWSCRTCWTVFHLGCIIRWATNEGSTETQQHDESEGLPPSRRWRCPGCNLPKSNIPSSYTCWCEKESDPNSIVGLPPHSCGQTCSKPRILPKQCPHPCELMCHAGPCPPCSRVIPDQICFCGKQAVTKTCLDTDLESGWSCEEVCGDLLPCGTHTCSQSCHGGLCGACTALMASRCYCGKSETEVPCCERSREEKSTRATDCTGSVDEWMGSFKCGEKCGRKFDCRKHQCERDCHPQDLEAPHCPRSPDAVSHCPCGKTLLRDFSALQRTSCEDPIPNCNKQCSKRLPCGHPCQQVCHSDNCGTCLLNVQIFCRCQRTESTTICHQRNNEAPQCQRTCKAVLSCGRHECGERCCSGERKAAERQAMKRKLKSSWAVQALDDSIEVEHICPQMCGRPLKCGNHTCPQLCHKGPCQSCREAIFEESSCHCGKTVLQPPLPCGTRPPLCRFECERPTLCGHPKVSHNCHGDEDSCPRCPYLSEKACLCRKSTLKNQPCFLTEVRCGEICGRKLRCGSHFCRKQCHRPGECEDQDRFCQQPCGKAKKACGHPCEDTCHAPSPCKEDRPCQNKMFITCECQHLRQEIKCNASKTSEGNTKKTLNCNEECAELARRQNLALALNVDPNRQNDHVPYTAVTLKAYKENLKWAQTQEKEFRTFAADDKEKRLRFKPMPAPYRAFLHSLAEDFGFESESLDPEPHRHVLVFKTSRFVKAPMKTLAECIRIRNAQPSSVPSTGQQRKLHRMQEPYNGFLLTVPRFGLTLDELRNDFAPVFDSTPGLAYDISFLPSEEIVIKARPASNSTAISASALCASIKAIKPSLQGNTLSRHLAGSIQLCTLDSSLNILRREVDDSTLPDGWSQVVSKGPAPKTVRPDPAVGQKSSFTVLGSRLKEKRRENTKKKKMEAEVVEDWEEEVRKEEEGAAIADGNDVETIFDASTAETA